MLAGWDSDNPAATWGGLLGFMNGRQGIESMFGQAFSSRFDIHRTRRGFPLDDGIDDFGNMAGNGVQIVDRVVAELMQGGIDSEADAWDIPGRPER